MRRSSKSMVLPNLGVLLVLLVTLASVLSEKMTCDHRFKLSNCRNNELNYEVEVDGPYGDKIIVEQKVRKVPNERSLVGRMQQRPSPFRDWVGSVFPTFRPGPIRQFINGGRQRSSRTAAGPAGAKRHRARANRMRRPRQGRTGARRAAARRNQL